MNYIIEDDFDFFKELNNVNEMMNNEKMNIECINNECMISRLPLTHNSIILPCKHAFNYLPLFKELCIHKNSNKIRCPYCRTASNKCLPFIPLPGVIKIFGINHPKKDCMPAPKCSVVLTTGSRKGLACNRDGMTNDEGTFCEKHNHYIKQEVWTEGMAKLMKDKSVIELKQMLKERGLKVGGVKKELVKRLLSEVLSSNS